VFSFVVRGVYEPHHKQPNLIQAEFFWPPAITFCRTLHPPRL
jgi:hypothetical protein